MEKSYSIVCHWLVSSLLLWQSRFDSDEHFHLFYTHKISDVKKQNSLDKIVMEWCHCP